MLYWIRTAPGTTSSQFMNMDQKGLRTSFVKICVTIRSKSHEMWYAIVCDSMVRSQKSYNDLAKRWRPLSAARMSR